MATVVCHRFRQCESRLNPHNQDTTPHHTTSPHSLTVISTDEASATATSTRPTLLRHQHSLTTNPAITNTCTLYVSKCRHHHQCRRRENTKTLTIPLYGTGTLINIVKFVLSALLEIRKFEFTCQLMQTIMFFPPSECVVFGKTIRSTVPLLTCKCVYMVSKFIPITNRTQVKSRGKTKYSSTYFTYNSPVV